MRTKTLLCLAVLTAGVATSMAQSNVYSLNIVGYVNRTILGSGAGTLNLIANPLDSGTNTINGVLNNAGLSLFDNFYHWNSGTGKFDISTWGGTSWSPDASFAPGEAGFINAQANFTNTFVGQVLTGTTTVPFAAGYSLVSSKVPLAGNLDTLNLSASLSIFDNILLWNQAGQKYDIYTYNGTVGSWSSPGGGSVAPSVQVGDGFFINAGAAGTWTQTFTP